MRKIICARSVHLRWGATDDCSEFSITLKPIKSVAGTYFMAVGWSQGYFGIQNLGNGHAGLICSVWDGQNSEPNLIHQAKAISCAPHATVRRFSGEGVGLQTVMPHFMLPLMRFRVRSRPLAEDPNWTTFSAEFSVSEKAAWTPFVTYLSRMEGRTLRGFYSFVEDFRRDVFSARESRRAIFCDAVSRVGFLSREALNSPKVTIALPEFEGDNWNARKVGETSFEISTGGRVKPTVTPGEFLK